MPQTSFRETNNGNYFLNIKLSAVKYKHGKMGQLDLKHAVVLIVFFIALMILSPTMSKCVFVLSGLGILFLLISRGSTHQSNEHLVVGSPAEKSLAKTIANANDMAQELSPAVPQDVYEESPRAQMQRLPANEYNPYPWMSNPKYTACYQPPAMDFNGCNLGSYLTLDEANARLAALRARDKRSLDGAVTKNADYFRKNFGRELDRAENERWWGNSEY